MPRSSDATREAIRAAVDIVSLVGDYLPLNRVGSKYKALCPFHDDHNPSLELNADRQSFKCWSCGAGGDIFDFVMDYERVEFPEALRMLAERAGVALVSAARDSSGGPTKSDLLAVNAWAEEEFVRAFDRSDEARSYAASRALTPETLRKFRVGFAPDDREWLVERGRRTGHLPRLLEAAGLIGRGAEGTGAYRDRFRGRLIFPIHDLRGRPVAFGGRILPTAEAAMVEAGLGVAKYLNTPETALFQKRRQLFAADLARASVREAGWVAVVEGYTDVAAAHQAGVANVVGTLGTALGEEHVQGLRRLADRVVLVFDGDEAGQKAADRSLPIFLANELDVRVTALPKGLDPADFIHRHGADAFRERLEGAVDALDFAVDRALEGPDAGDLEGARRAAESVLAVLARVPVGTDRVHNQLKVQLAVDRLAGRLRLPPVELMAALRKMRRGARPPGNHVELRKNDATPTVGGLTSERASAEAESAPAIRPSDLDLLDRELIRIILNEPTAVETLITRVDPSSLRDAPLRAILRACYDLFSEGQPSSFDRVSERLDDPGVRALAAALLLPIVQGPLSERVQPASWRERLEQLVPMLVERDRTDRLRELTGALAESDPNLDPVGYRELWRERLRLAQNRRPAVH